MSHHISDASLYLRALAARNVRAYVADPRALAAIVMGSAATGEADHYSDLDVAVYYDTLPTDEEIARATESIGGAGRHLLGPPEPDALLETYTVWGVDCQVVHVTASAWERDMHTVLVGLDVTSPLQKALSGLLEAHPLHGAPLIQRWQSQLAAYPDALASAMVEHYLAALPRLGVADRLLTRDATLWLRQIAVETEQSLLGILAGLNRLYYTPFQFKRVHPFAAALPHAPHDLANRLDAVLSLAPTHAIAHLHALTAETIDLVETHMPGVNTTTAHQRLAWRPQPWSPTSNLHLPPEPETTHQSIP